MSNDIYGYDNNVKSAGAIASADYCHITIGTRVALAQNLQGTHNQEIEKVTQLGDTQIYWLPGRPAGSLSATKLVGASGFFEGWRGHDCGKITNLAVSVDGGRCGFNGSGNITFSQGIVQSFSFSLNAGQSTIAESISIMTSGMSAS